MGSGDTHAVRIEEAIDENAYGSIKEKGSNTNTNSQLTWRKATPTCCDQRVTAICQARRGLIRMAKAKVIEVNFIDHRDVGYEAYSQPHVPSVHGLNRSDPRQRQRRTVHPRCKSMHGEISPSQAFAASSGPDPMLDRSWLAGLRPLTNAQTQKRGYSSSGQRSEVQAVLGRINAVVASGNDLYDRSVEYYSGLSTQIMTSIKPQSIDSTDRRLAVSCPSPLINQIWLARQFCINIPRGQEDLEHKEACPTLNAPSKRRCDTPRKKARAPHKPRRNCVWSLTTVVIHYELERTTSNAAGYAPSRSSGATAAVGRAQQTDKCQLTSEGKPSDGLKV
ncbi:hypothetical protein BDN72DRAFT_856794 [Pluteus cervinus]|uniref:Uncharacterized protein n=1 Tax=Pluteus cervinus TaxID=181527 RepID=A0ACD3AYC3_9AGAR|nr:hypothetical protein BDN72DRAFT_856794 [Pluteus cervinus]